MLWIGQKTRSRRLPALCAIFVSIWMGFASPANAVRIGLFADPAATSCNIQIPPSTGRTLYLLAILDDAPANGLRAYELRVTGIPTNWFASFTANGFISQLGNPITGGGLVSASTCMTSTNRILQLGTVSVFATSAVSNVALRVEAHAAPSNSEYACPVIALCDVGNSCVPQAPLPKYSKLCVEGLESVINGSPCTVDAPDETESQVRISVWPNPGKGSATVSFEAGRSAPVELVVYDLAGRRVRQLFVANVGPGARSIVWDGRDDIGREAASGVYFVHLTAGKAVSRVRLTLLR
jgi:flagellar hook capping protein FlgD